MARDGPLMQVAHTAVVLLVITAAGVHAQPAPAIPGPTAVAADLHPTEAGLTVGEPGQDRPAKPRAPKTPRPAPTPDTVAPPTASSTASTLDLDSLEQRLRATKAIGVFTKITLKNQIDDLLDRFRDYYKGKGKRTMKDLRRSFDLLLMKVLSLLQDDDRELASAIVASREAIWALLADPKTFATLEG